MPVSEGFEPVADVFADVVGAQGGTGAGLAVWYDGAWVVDLWGGWSDARRTRPWRSDSVVMTYSVTKPFAALCALVLADRGLLNLDDPVSTYWPELTARTTMRQVLAHQSGIVVLDEPAPTETFYDWNQMCRLLERQAPAWEPGTAHGESALLYGHLVGEVVRRVDGRSLGRFLREEVCGPAGLDFHIGLGDDELTRVVELTYDDGPRRYGGDGEPDLFVQALSNPPGALDPVVTNGHLWRAAEIPAVNGHGTARGVAGLYVALQQGRLLSSAMLAEATTVTAQGMDRVLGTETQWGLGFGLEADGFGMGGVGGSFGWWSERGRYAVGFVTGLIADHDRGERLEDAVRDVLGLPAV